MPGKVKWLWSINGGSNVDTSNLVTTNTNQTITGDKQFNSNTQFNKVVEIHNGTDNDCSMAIHREANKANFIGFYKGDTRIGYMGRNSSGSDNFSVGSDLGDLQLLAHSNISCNSKRLINVANPNATTDAANKAYVDSNKYADNFTKITNFTITQADATEDFRQKFDFTNMQNNFRVANNTCYEVLFKHNVNSMDIYSTAIVAVNEAGYSNVGLSSVDAVTLTGHSSIQYAITLKNNQFKLHIRKVSGTDNWTINVVVFARKIGGGTFQ